MMLLVSESVNESWESDPMMAPRADGKDKSVRSNQEYSLKENI